MAIETLTVDLLIKYWNDPGLLAPEGLSSEEADKFSNDLWIKYEEILKGKPIREQRKCDACLQGYGHDAPTPDEGWVIVPSSPEIVATYYYGAPGEEAEARDGFPYLERWKEWERQFHPLLAVAFRAAGERRYILADEILCQRATVVRSRDRLSETWATYEEVFGWQRARRLNAWAKMLVSEFPDRFRMPTPDEKSDSPELFRMPGTAEEYTERFGSEPSG